VGTIDPELKLIAFFRGDEALAALTYYATHPQSVALAAYGDYAPGYIATEIAYSQGGYEASLGASKVAPSVEGVLMAAIHKLLGSK
jgi:hypothetical protein